MRAALILGVAAACSGPAESPAIATRPTVLPIERHRAAHTCTEAAVGLEHGTVDVREPDVSIVEVARARCAADAWPYAAIDCFVAMRPGDLGRCAARLGDPARESLFVALGIGDDATDLARAQARLATLEVHIAECDQFIARVRSVIACDGLPLASRAALGRDVTDFWSLPTDGLPAAAAQRMADVCTSSLADLDQRTSGSCPK